MANRTLRVLHVEDQERDVALLMRHLKRAGYDLTFERVETPAAMRAALAAQAWDVILCDYSMPHFNALAALAVLQETGLDIPFIIISGTVGEAVAVAAMRAGANDYLMKDNLARLAPTIEREMHEAENRRARRRAEAELQQSEVQYRRLLDTAYEGIWMADVSAHIIYANQRLADMLGYTVAEMIGRSAFEVLDEAERAKMKVNWQRRLQGIEEQYDLRLLRKDGSYIWVILSVTPIRDEQGEVTGALAMLTDISERKRAEEAQRRSEEKYRGIFDNATMGIYQVAPDGTLLTANYTLARMLGYDATEELLQRNLAEDIYYRTEERAELLARYEPSSVVVAVEVLWKKKDGSSLWVHINCRAIKDETGQTIYFDGFAHDITERKRAEQELSKSEERYRDLVENAHDIIYSHDLAGSYISVNKVVEQILGYTPEEALRLNLAQIVAPEYLEKARQMIASKLAGERVTAYDLELIAKDGRRIAVEVNTKLIYQEGVAVGVQGIARDVTERKLLEEQLRQAQKMEAVGQLAGGVAHDFNNLLTAITGYSELTLMRLQAADPLRRNIEEVKKAGERAAALTRQLLAFSRKQVLQPKVIDLNAVVSELEKMLRRLIGEDIGLRTALAPTLGSIKADPGQIEQIIMNLVVNARDAMPQGGKLTIETQNVYLDEDYAKTHIAVTPGPYVLLAVSDTGTGMDEKIRARIFEPFFTTKEVGKGTGLGLSTVYGIVKQSGGNIWVYSEVGLGTTFKVYLPRVDEGAEEYQRGAETEAALYGTETILLAEDEEMVRKLAREVLEMYGYQVLEAANGGAALLICERHTEPIHLLITDVIMPEMSGRKLAARLARLRPEMKVLYMSGYTDNAIVHQGVLDEGTNFIQKPFAPHALAQKVRAVLAEEARKS
ncbi:MAG: PAS domain S-box protein [Pyrinomonadaceae bacterium]